MFTFALLAACGGDDGDVPPPPDETGTPPTTETETGTPPTDTDPPLPEYFEVADIFVQGQLGYDSATQLIGVVERLNGTFEYPLIEVILADAEFSGDLADTAHYCSILLVLESSLVADWVTTDPRLVWGVDWDPKDPPITTCNTPGFELNPFEWGLDPVATFTSDPTWGLAVGAPTDSLRKQLEPTLGDDVQYLLGGSLRVPDLLPGDPVENVYGYAYAVDAELKLVDGEEDGRLDLIPADQVHDGTSLLTSAYVTLYALTAWSLE